MRARVPASEVDDVLQVAAMRALEKHASLRDPLRVLAWLFTIHRNAIADAVRKAGHRERLVDRARAEAANDHASELPAMLAEPVCRCSLAQVERLSDPYASMLTLVDLGDLSVAEASRTLGISPNNGAVRLHRARKALRERMLEHCGVSSARECAQCRCIDEGCCA